MAGLVGSGWVGRGSGGPFAAVSWQRPCRKVRPLFFYYLLTTLLRTNVCDLRNKCTLKTQEFSIELYKWLNNRTTYLNLPSGSGALAINSVRKVKSRLLRL